MRLFVYFSLLIGVARANPNIALSTANGAQSLNGAYIVSTSVGVPLTLDANASTGTGSLSFTWTQTSGPPVNFSSPNSAITNVTTSAFGTAYVTLTVRDFSGTTTQNIKVGGVVTDSHNVVVPSDSRVSNVIGPMIRLGANPWTWADNRAVAMAAEQMLQQSSFWVPFWNTPSPHGTLSLTKDSNVVTGSGTQFQTDFCGGPGNTTPVVHTIAIWYPSPLYPGTYGRWIVIPTSCVSQTSMLVNVAYEYTPGVTAGLTYSPDVNSSYDYWIASGIPGNYYDNVLAFYGLYYRSGIDDFLNAARYLAPLWWSGPLNRGEGYNFNLVGGTFAGQPRITAATGIVLWSFDQGVDIWPGMSYVWAYWYYLMVTFNQNKSWNVNAGNLREDAYMMAGFSLCYLYDPNAGDKAMCIDALHSTINNLWAPLEINNTWQTINPDSLAFASGDNSVSVTVTDGSRDITLHGSTWSAANFSGSQPYDEWVWFCDRCWHEGWFGFNGASPARQNSDLGDTVAYQLSYVLDGARALLSKPYDSGGRCPFGCNKSMSIGQLSGMGTQPYMQGMLAGVFATYVYQALTAAGDNYAGDLALVKRFVSDSLTFLQSSYDPAGQGMFGAMNYLSCTGASQYAGVCGPGLSLSGEAMRGFSAGYAMFPTTANRLAGNVIYNSMWAKPAYSAPLALNPSCSTYLGSVLGNCYMLDADDSSVGGYMLTTGDYRTNKWFGFFNGYGFGASWPAVIARVPANWKQRWP